MSTQQSSTQPQAGNGRNTGQPSQAELTQVLQPIVSQLGQQIEQIVKEQMGQTRESASKLFEQALHEPQGGTTSEAEQETDAGSQGGAPSAKQQTPDQATSQQAQQQDQPSQ